MVIKQASVASNGAHRISLVVQLWLVIVVIALSGLICSVLISGYNVKSSFSEQLYLKNVDNANTLALSLTQMNKDPVTVELFVSAAFDTGHYQQIKLLDTQGEVIVERSFAQPEHASVPNWFAQMFAFEVGAGVAQISNGWQQYGTLYIQSQQRYALEALWDNVLNLANGFALIALFSCVAASIILRWILRPLQRVVVQAQSFSKKQFLQLPLPNTAELAQVTEAMNHLAERFADILREGNERIARAQYLAQHDEVTGLANGRYFLSRMEQELRQVAHRQQVLVLMRLTNYEQLRGSFTPDQFHVLEKELAQLLIRYAETQQDNLHDWQLGRISHCDLALRLNEVMAAEDSSRTLTQYCSEFSDTYNGLVELRHSITYIEEKQSGEEALQEGQRLLAMATASGVDMCADAVTEDAPVAAVTGQSLMQALEKEQFELKLTDVLNFDNSCVQSEVGLYLKVGNKAHSRSYYQRLLSEQQLDAQLDWKTVKKFFNEKLWLHYSQPFAIRLSESTLADEITYTSILALISSEEQLAPRLTLEFSELCLINMAEQVKEFCREAKLVGCHLGLTDAGQALNQVDGLEQLGLDFIKLDNTLVHNISNDEATQQLVRHICAQVRPLGVMVVVEELAQDIAVELLKELGVSARIQAQQGH
ncbi:hypothetical protein CWC24_15390 [Pseudoalteromonas ruthenica]|nr:hypothetical protein CWC24_15390 [Pseudoalteromonas ruthenica]TMO51752.1 hypothetical protein CWC23_05125 [Pseudoalteromonas ruthenica]